MIAFRTLKAVGILTNVFDETQIGEQGADGDWNGFILDATDAGITVRLPLASKCTGKVLSFTVVNPSGRSVTVNKKLGSSDSIWFGSSLVTTMSASGQAMVTMICDGQYWFVIGVDGFA